MKPGKWKCFFMVSLQLSESSKTFKCKIFYVCVFVRSRLFFLFSFHEGDSAGGITALFLVEAIRCDNTLNLSVVFCAFFIENTHRDKDFYSGFLGVAFETERSFHSDWSPRQRDVTWVVQGVRRSWVQPAGSSDPLGVEPLATPELLCWKPAMKPVVWRGALQALGDLHTNPLCDSTQIGGLQTQRWWVCYKCLDR